MNKCLTLVHLTTNYTEYSPVVLQPLARLPRRALVGTDPYIAIWVTCGLPTIQKFARSLNKAAIAPATTPKFCRNAPHHTPGWRSPLFRVQ
jgi:hypothetical protein